MKIDKEIGNNTEIGKSAVLKPHVLIGNNCKVAGEVQEYSCFGNNVIVSEGATIKSTIAMSNVKIGENSKIEQSVLGESCVIGSNVTLIDTVLGDKCIINNNIKLLNTRIDPNEER